ncbi:MAG: MTH1187 family thiamine-binding protein, partial [Dehalococcoidales bacterium]|nr:MTH1187 family thiamine-binding protein [Dehalococcoidales bacterium]
MAIIEVSVIPLGTGSPSVSRYVAETERVLQRETDIKYELTAMGTIVEGELEILLALVRKMHRTILDMAGV